MEKTNTSTYKRYPSKILLFGEYLLLRGATALSVPLDLFAGHWAWSGKKGAPPMQGRLPEFAQSRELHEIPNIDIAAFEEELSRGLWLRSNIPGGYGLGSSGTVVAAVYDRYCTQKTSDLDELKAHFSIMEGFFHEKSSGIDPLTSYLAQPVVVKNKTEAQIIERPKWEDHFQIYLLDTKKPRSTSKFIHQYLQRLNDPRFAQRLDDFIRDVHEPMAEAMLAGDFEAFWQGVGETSKFQWQQLQFLIHESLDYRWVEGLKTGDYFLKICGAGGGGYALLFVKKKSEAEFLNRLHRLTNLLEP